MQMRRFEPRLPLAVALALSVPALSVPAAVLAQAAAPVAPATPADPVMDMMTDMGEDILVVAQIQRGAVEGDIQPEIQLRPEDVMALGVSSMQDVLDQLSPQLTSSGGRGGERPVVLLNGNRISGFREIRSIPPEAIERIDILPEEVSLTYGYPATQKVMNIVLRSRFRAVTAEAKGGMPTAGGRGEADISLNLVNIAGASRLTVDLGYSRQGMITENERNVVGRASGSLTGNITPAGGAADIDPALSALAGMAVTVAGVPAVAATGAPTLGDFLNSANQSPNQPAVSDQGRYRSLVSRSQSVSAGASLSRPLGGMQGTFRASLDAGDSHGLQGLPEVSLLVPAGNPFSPFASDVTLNRLADSPLRRDSRNWTGTVSTALLGRVGGYQLALNGSWEHGEDRTVTDRGIDASAIADRIIAGDADLNPFAPGAISGPLMQDRATSNSEYANAEAVLSGQLASLPAGSVRTTVKLGFDWRDLSSRAWRSGVAQAVDLDRSTASSQLSIDVPLTSRNNDVLAAIGDLSLNFNGAATRLSDFGTLTTWGAGLRWAPVAALRLSASVTHEEGAPSMTQLGNPETITPNVRVFDFLRGETVLISRLDGGNAGLGADNRRVLKLGANFQARRTARTTLSLTANYTDSRIDDPIASFPTATAELEAAFPERFTRDADGRLLRIDNRPVNFAQSHSRDLRWGLFWMQKFPAPAPARTGGRAEGAQRTDGAQRSGGAPEGARGPGRGPGGGSGGGFGGGGRGGPGGSGGPEGGAGGQLMVSLFHSWRFQDTIRINSIMPDLDLLNGSATGSSGGVARHSIEARVNVAKNGFGARLSGNWAASTNVLVDPRGPASPDDLHFSALTTIDLSLFADLGQRPGLVAAHPFFKGARVSLDISNLFDSRMHVSDRAGVTPVAYQRDLLDPVGRRVMLSFRKLFS